MNLNQLRYANAVASRRSFTGAATECCVTQSTLSNAIAQLEDELGARLFVRTTRKVELTPFGEHLVPYISEVLNAQATVVSQTKAFLHPTNRLIRIGTSPLLNAALLGLMLEPFRLDNPEVDVVLREMNMADLSRMLDAGLLDYVFGVANVGKERRLAATLYDEPLFFVPRGAASGGLPFGSVRLKDIADETYVMVPDACGLSRATRALFRSQRRKLKEYSGEAMSYQVLQDWAALSIGAAILPKSKVTGNVAYFIKGSSDQEIRIKFEATWREDKARASHLRAFEKHLYQVVPSIVRGTAVMEARTPSAQQEAKHSQ
jgi:LysR family transcriptional regulator, hydrogen peroxide-inducible genes activator